VVGGVIGAVAGAVGGGYAGKAVGEMIDPTGTDEHWRDNYASRQYAKGATYEEYQPAYQYGANVAHDIVTSGAGPSRRTTQATSSVPAMPERTALIVTEP